MAAPKQQKADDVGQEQVQSVFDEAREKGYLGDTPESHPNSAFSLQSGPDSPSVAEQNTAALEQRAKDARASVKG